MTTATAESDSDTAEVVVLQNLGLENEVFVSIDPEKPIDLPTPLPQLPSPGPRLPKDPAKWLADGDSWRGSGAQLHISEGTAGDSQPRLCTA